MSRSRNWIAIGSASALILSLIASVGGPTQVHADQQITLTVWDQFTSDPGSAAVSALYKSYTATHPNVKIRREAQQTDQMRQVVKTAVASGSGPDIIYYDAGPGYAGVLAHDGLLVPLSSYAAKYHWATRFSRAALDGSTIGGKLYGLPLEVDLIGMYYNKTLIDKAGLTVPQTTDQLLTFCAQAKAKGYYGVDFSDNPGWQAFHQFTMVANNIIGPAAMGQLLLKGMGSWTTSQMVQAIKIFFVDMQNAGCFPPHVNSLMYADQNTLFDTGKALLNTTGSWQATEYSHTPKHYQIGIVPFPSVPGGKGRYFDTGVGSAFFISSKGAHQDAAAQFIDWLFSPQALKVWVEKVGAFPPVAFDTSTLQVTPLVQFILGGLQSSIRGKTSLGYNIDVLAPSLFNNEMQNGFQAVLAGKKTPQQEAAALQSAWTKGKSGS